MEKYRMLLFCILTYALTSCEKTDDGINAEYSAMAGSPTINGIVLYNYEGKDIIEVQNGLFSSTNQHQHFCDGTKLNLNDFATFKKYKEERKEIAILFGTKMWQ